MLLGSLTSLSSLVAAAAKVLHNTQYQIALKRRKVKIFSPYFKGKFFLGGVGWLRGWKPLVQMDLELVRQQIFRLCQEGQTVSFSFIHPSSDAIASIEAFPFDDITAIKASHFQIFHDSLQVFASTLS